MTSDLGKRVFALLLLLLALVAVTSAHAHKSSDSYLTLDVAGGQLHGRWDIALRDLDPAIGLDRDGDGGVTWGEVLAASADIEAYALGRLAVRAGSEACPLTAAAPMIENHSDGAYVVLALSGRCAGARPVSVDYRLLFDLDARHQGLARIQVDGASQATTFRPATPVQTFGGAASGGALTTFARFIAQGVEHIATGWDHLLFLLALLLPAVMVRTGKRWHPATNARAAALSVVGIVTAFTLAHSITLSLAVLHIVSVPSRLVESAIAASVVLAALDNIVPFLPRRRWLLAFGFGLVHGLGFASVLLELSLPRGDLAISLVGFNLGVELGQLAVVALVVPLAFFARTTRAYARFALAAGSAVIAAISLAWFVERAFLVPVFPG